MPLRLSNLFLRSSTNLPLANLDLPAGPDIRLDKLREKLNEDAPHIDELIYTACMSRLIKEKKIMLEGETMYLTA